MAHIKSKGYPLEIKDEDKYTSILKKCFTSPRAERYDDRSVVIPVKISTNGDVISGYGKIGEISWQDIDWYLELYGEVEHTADCKIYTRTGELFGAWLSVTLTEFTAPKLLAKNLPNADISLSMNTPEQLAVRTAPVTKLPKVTDVKPSKEPKPPKPPKQPPPPPKPWRELDAIEKTITVLIYLFLLGLLYIAYRIIAWFFGLIF